MWTCVLKSVTWHLHVELKVLLLSTCNTGIFISLLRTNMSNFEFIFQYTQGHKNFTSWSLHAKFCKGLIEFPDFDYLSQMYLDRAWN